MYVMYAVENVRIGTKTYPNVRERMSTYVNL